VYDPLKEPFSAGGTALDGYEPLNAFDDGTIGFRVHERHESMRSAADSVGARIHERHLTAMVGEAVSCDGSNDASEWGEWQ
jgi:hypothetical protein